MIIWWRHTSARFRFEFCFVDAASKYWQEHPHFVACDELWTSNHIKAACLSDWNSYLLSALTVNENHDLSKSKIFDLSYQSHCLVDRQKYQEFGTTCDKNTNTHSKATIDKWNEENGKSQRPFHFTTKRFCFHSRRVFQLKCCPLAFVVWYVAEMKYEHWESGDYFFWMQRHVHFMLSLLSSSFTCTTLSSTTCHKIFSTKKNTKHIVNFQLKDFHLENKIVQNVVVVFSWDWLNQCTKTGLHFARSKFQVNINIRLIGKLSISFRKSIFVEIMLDHAFYAFVGSFICSYTCTFVFRNFNKVNWISAGVWMRVCVLFHFPRPTKIHCLLWKIAITCIDLEGQGRVLCVGVALLHICVLNNLP